MPRSIPAIRRFLPMIAIAGLAGCAPALPDMPPLACPVAKTQSPYGIPDSFQDSIKRPGYWRQAVNHGSDAQLAYIIAAGQNPSNGPVDRRLVQYGMSAQRFRLENNCPDIADSTIL